MLSWMILLYAYMHVDTLISMGQIKMDYVIYPMVKYGGEMNLQIVICYIYIYIYIIIPVKKIC